MSKALVASTSRLLHYGALDGGSCFLARSRNIMGAILKDCQFSFPVVHAKLEMIWGAL